MKTNKRCNICSLVKRISEFSSLRSSKDGLQSKCKSCDQSYRKENEKTIKLGLVKWRQENPQSNKNWRRNNPNYFSDRYRDQKERLTIINEAYKERNRFKFASLEMKRRTLKIKATPNWLTPEHFKQIEQFYINSQELSLSTGIRHEVDHIIPLRGKFMSGLHVPWNLRVTTRKFNRRRRRNLDPFNMFKGGQNVRV